MTSRINIGVAKRRIGYRQLSARETQEIGDATFAVCSFPVAIGKLFVQKKLGLGS